MIFSRKLFKFYLLKDFLLSSLISLHIFMFNFYSTIRNLDYYSPNFDHKLTPPTWISLVLDIVYIYNLHRFKNNYNSQLRILLTSYFLNTPTKSINFDYNVTFLLSLLLLFLVFTYSSRVFQK